MWPFRDAKSAVPTFQVDNTIGGGSRVRGDLMGPGGFRVDGIVEGAIDAGGPVVIGEGGAVEGSVRGTAVVVLGTVHGDVQASGHLEIGPRGKVIGDITVTSFRLHTGGIFRGRSCMPGGEEAILALGAASREVETRRGRTLPPPVGAVPPPPTLSELAEGSLALRPTPLPITDEPQSHERLVSSVSPVSGASQSPRRTGT
ncbi:MAG: hypothetical protein JWP97_5318 [Labilithrix sp.]|nr:hypothetical protein [Labilithrix sp.]